MIGFLGFGDVIFYAAIGIVMVVVLIGQRRKANR